MSLRTKLFVCSIAIFILSMFSIIALIWNTQNKSSTLLQNEVATSVKLMISEQKKSGEEVAVTQKKSAAERLTHKVNSLTSLLSKLAKDPIENFDFEVLNDYCQQICNDEDIILAYVTDDSGEIITEFANKDSSEINLLINKRPESITELAAELLKSDSVHKTQMKVLSSNDPIGNAVLLSVDTSLRKQSEMIHKNGKILQDNSIKLANDLSTKINNITEQTTKKFLNESLIIIILEVFISLICLYLISRSIFKPIKQITDRLRLLATIGDLGDHGLLSPSRNDEVGELSKSLSILIEDYRNFASICKQLARGDWTATTKIKSEKDELGQAVQKLIYDVNLMLHSVNDISSQVNLVSTQIYETSHSLSNSSTESASYTDNITTSIKDINNKTSESTENAIKANKLTKDSAKIANDGHINITNMVEAMDEIHKSSNEINSIIKTIEEIAFQTNLLALNAAVEAARAGIHGKGFAVVAEEVRALASKSAQAVHKTEELINSSNNKIENGTIIAKKSSESFEEITKSISEVSVLIDKMTTSIKNQATNFSKINEDISQIDTAINANTSQAKDTAIVADTMSHQSSLLEQLVHKFKLNNEFCDKNISEISFEANNINPSPNKQLD